MEVLSIYWIFNDKKKNTRELCLLSMPSLFQFLIIFLHRECILCRAFSLGLNPKECETKCVHLNLTLVGQAGVLATVPPSSGLHRCMEVDTEGCRVHFQLRTGQKEGSVHVHVALERGMADRILYFVHDGSNVSTTMEQFNTFCQLKQL